MSRTALLLILNKPNMYSVLFKNTNRDCARLFTFLTVHKGISH